MRSNRVATAAVVAGLALLGSVSAGVSGITAGATEPVPAAAHHHPDHDGDHSGPREAHRF
jgi:Spy/CpxP family protein refolding chaperone